MLKIQALLIGFFFMLATSVAPYVTSQQMSFTASSDTTEERTFSNPNFEEEIHHDEISHDIAQTDIVIELGFPHHLILQPQHVVAPTIKPPLA